MTDRNEFPDLETAAGLLFDPHIAYIKPTPVAEARRMGILPPGIRVPDNLKLYEHYERLMNQLAYQRLVVRTVEHPGRIAASTQEHHAVLEMIEHKDPFGAEAAMRNHVYATSREALNSEPALERR